MSGKIYKTVFFVASVVLLFLFSGHLCVATAGVIKGGTIEKAVRAYVEKNMFWSEGAVRVEFPGKVSDVTLSGEKITCRVRSKRNEDFIGNTSFTVRFYEDGELLGKQTVRARLEVLMAVVVSSRSLPRNTEIGRGDVRLIKRWFARPPLNIISSPDDVVGTRLCAGIKPNTEITGNMVRAIPVVQKGKPVRIIIENGSMGMTTIGMSEQDGMRGELIKVRNVSSKKMIYARVMDTSLVKVEF
ncbi:MAG: flagellar basal body P-ring formation protein FlgA [Deltaproteobacteria bacterium]|nr:flagellar basal body P-ring formation protein FlgA [Deltaproteobacteria bacterium]